jgi:hypothetical protein
MGSGTAGLPGPGWLTRGRASPAMELGELDRKSSRTPLSRDRSIAGLALLLGALILWLAVPRVVASALLAMRDPVVERTDEGEQVSDAELLSLIASRELALSWVEDRESHAERATAIAKLAFQQAPEGAAREATLKRAVDALRAGLALAPADPRGWMQLAYLLVLLDGDTSRQAARALLVSIRTGAFEATGFLNRRLFWSLAHWSLFDDAERRQIGDQIRLVWQLTPGELTELPRDPGFFRSDRLRPGQESAGAIADRHCRCDLDFRPSVRLRGSGASLSPGFEQSTRRVAGRSVALPGGAF